MTAAIVFSVLLITGNALFVAFEFSLITARRGDINDLAAQGNRAARRVLRQMEDVDGYLAACQFGITLTSLALTAVFEPAVQQSLTPFLAEVMTPQLAVSVSVVVAIVVATIVQVIVGELFPKTVAITIPTPIVLWTSWPMKWAYRLSAPLNYTYNRLANQIVRLLTGKSVLEANKAQIYDTDVLLSLAHQQGHINDDQHELMQAVLEFTTRTAREVMTPADRVISFRVDDEAQTVYAQMREARHTRYPVFDGDDLIGYVLMHDIFRQRLEGVFDLKAILREIPGIPETVHLDRLRAEYREHPILAVYDERNQFVGIITGEDLLEEIVGEILDEDEEPDRPPVERLASGLTIIDGTALIEEVSAALELQFEVPDGVDTFGGLLLSHLGREPQCGDEIALPPWKFTVKECEGFSILLVEGEELEEAMAPAEAPTPSQS